MNAFVSRYNTNISDAIYLMASVYEEHPRIIYDSILHRAREYNRVQVRDYYVWLTKGQDKFMYKKGRLK